MTDLQIAELKLLITQGLEALNNIKLNLDIISDVLTDQNDGKCIKDAVDLITEVSYFRPSMVHYCGPVGKVGNATKHTNFYFTFNHINDFPEKIVSINSQVIKYRKNINNNKWLFSTNEDPIYHLELLELKLLDFAADITTDQND